MKMPNKPRRDNPYQPPCFDDFPKLQHQHRDRRAPPLVVVHTLIVRLKAMATQQYTIAKVAGHTAEKIFERFQAWHDSRETD